MIMPLDDGGSGGGPAAEDGSGGWGALAGSEGVRRMLDESLLLPLLHPEVPMPVWLCCPAPSPSEPKVLPSCRCTTK